MIFALLLKLLKTFQTHENLKVQTCWSVHLHVSWSLLQEPAGLIYSHPVFTKMQTTQPKHSPLGQTEPNLMFMFLRLSDDFINEEISMQLISKLAISYFEGRPLVWFCQR
ncbi:hypothetical protein XENOCAPTIV_025669 [Xenoophorus captivus]|uniref:Uncharacterized protein n=1 Tax=Xenoophorus captivus TaxID=1517983 RepID=A0ABV0QN04_9TELE